MLPTHWRVRPGPGVSAGLLAGGAGPRVPRAGVGWPVGERFLTQLGLGSRVS